MLRSIKSAQRKLRIIAIAFDENGILDCPDKHQVSISSEGGTTTIKILQGFAGKPVVLCSSNVQVVDSSTVTIPDVFVRADMIIIGKDSTENY